METEREPEMACIVDGSWGIYVPQRFAERGMAEAWGVSADDIAVLLAGPDNEAYWETWDDVLGDASFRDKKGKVWSLEQDGDLFAVCYT